MSPRWSSAKDMDLRFAPSLTGWSWTRSRSPESAEQVDPSCVAGIPNWSGSSSAERALEPFRLARPITRLACDNRLSVSLTDAPGDDTAGATPVTPAPTTIPARASKRESRRTAGGNPGLSGLTDDDLEKWLASEGLPAFRARQIRDAVWRQNASTADELKPLPNALRARIDEEFRIDTIVEDQIKVADNGLTEKTLHLLSDGALIESVLMHYPARGFGGPGRPMHRERHTLCISSQAGCAVGCPFCATGELGFGRDLDTAEIVDQVRHAARRLGKTGRNITNLVFMGMGEPLLNLDRVLESVSILSDPRSAASTDRSTGPAT